MGRLDKLKGGKSSKKGSIKVQTDEFHLSDSLKNQEDEDLPPFIYGCLLGFTPLVIEVKLFNTKYYSINSIIISY